MKLILIKREKFYEALIFIEDDTLKEKLYSQEDAMTLFCLLRVANSLIIIEDIGYVYLLGLNNKSLMSKMYDSNSANLIFHSNFYELRLLFKKTKNDSHDKNVCVAYFQMIINLHSKLAKYVTKGYELFDEVFTLLLKCPFYGNEKKNYIKIFYDMIMTNRKKNF